MDHSIQVEELTQSYTRQLERYKELKVIVQKILGQIALSRGNFSGVMGLFEEKQRLLELIDRERENMKDSAEIWQKEKNQIPSSEHTARLDAVLAETEEAIKSFLEIEDQLKKYLERTMDGKGNKATS